jgi:hypothetical protein
VDTLFVWEPGDLGDGQDREVLVRVG